MHIATQILPLIFLRIAENVTGESDMTLTASSSTIFQSEGIDYKDSIFLDFDYINQNYCLLVPDEVKGCTPRWYAPIIIYNQNDKYDFSQRYNNKIGANLIIIDQEREKKIGIGRNREMADMIGGKGIVSRNVKNFLEMGEVEENEVIKFTIDMSMFLDQNLQINDFVDGEEYVDDIGEKESTQEKVKKSVKNQLNQYLKDGENEELVGQLTDYLNNIEQILPQNFFRTQNFEKKTSQEWVELFSDRMTDFLFEFPVNFTIPVAQYVDDFDGIMPSNTGHACLIDRSGISYIIENNKDQIITQLLRYILNNKKSFLGEGFLRLYFKEQADFDRRLQKSMVKFNNNLNQFALTVEGVLKNRESIYLGSQMSNYKKKIGDELVQYLGKGTNAHPTFLLMETFSGYLLMIPFIEDVFLSASIILILICCYIIYSIALTDIENQVTKFSIFRILGLPQKNLFYLLLIKGILFSSPTFLIGLVLYNLAKIGASFAIQEMYKFNFESGLDLGYLIKAFLLGIVIPLISSILPARRAFKQNLRDSLDQNKRFEVETKIIFHKLEKMGLGFYTFITSILLIAVGEMSYLLVPQAFIQKDINLFYAFINCTLLLFIYGLVQLIQLLQDPLQRFLVWFFMKFLASNGISNLKKMVYNNFYSHERKLKKISFIFTLSFAFLVFITMGINLITQVITNTVSKVFGGDFVILKRPYYQSLDEEAIRQFVQIHQQRYPDIIEGITFLSVGMDDVPGVGKTYISINSNRDLDKVIIRAADPLFLDVGFDQFYIPNGYYDKIEFGNLKDSNRKNGMYAIYEEIEDINKLSDFQKGKNIYLEDIKKKYDGEVFNPYLELQDQKFISRGRYKPEDELKYKDTYRVASNGDMIYDFFVKNAKSGVNTRNKYHFRENKQEQIIESIVGTNIMNALGLEVGQQFQIVVQARSRYYNIGLQFRCRITHAVDYLPIENHMSPKEIRFNPFGRPEIMISQQQYNFIMNQVWQILDQNQQKSKIPAIYNDMGVKTSFGIPVHKAVFRFKRKLTEIERMDIQDGLKNFLTKKVVTFDVQSLIYTVQNGLGFLSYFMNFVAVIVMLLGLFLITVLFQSAIKEKIQEFKIMRATGVNFRQIKFIYLIESVSVVCAAGMLGAILGTLISITLSYEVTLLLESQLKDLNINYFTIIGLFVVGFFSAYLGAAIPLKKYKNVSISAIDKLED